MRCEAYACAAAGWGFGAQVRVHVVAGRGGGYRDAFYGVAERLVVFFEEEAYGEFIVAGAGYGDELFEEGNDGEITGGSSHCGCG